jgi:hypothetical protein
VGIHKFSNGFYKSICHDYATKVKEQPKLGYEYEILSMAQGGVRVYVQNITGLRWYEIDDLSDLAYVSPPKRNIQKPFQKSRNFNILEKAVCKRNVHLL